MMTNAFGCRLRSALAGLSLLIMMLASSSVFAAQTFAPAAAAPAVVLPGVPANAPSGGSSTAVIPAAPADRGPIAPGSRLTLQHAIKIALKFFPRLREREAQSHAAQQEVGVARSLMGPQVYATSQYLRATNNGIGNTAYFDPLHLYPRMTGTNHDQPANDFSQNWDTSNDYMNGLAVTQFLFDFGRHREFVAQRRSDARATLHRTQLAEMRLIFEVSQRYFNLLRAAQLIRVYEKAVEQRKFHLHEAQVKAQAGLRPQLDVYVTTAEVERAQLHLLDARNAQADAKVALDNAMGLSESAPQYQLTDVPAYSPLRQKLTALMATAMRMRPDLQMGMDDARAMGAEIAQYRSDYYPTVNAVGGYTAMGTGLPMVNNFSVGILITWPIFNSFETTHQMAAVRLQRAAIEHAIEDLRQQIILQVKTAFLNWQASIERIRRAKQTLMASRAELELAEKRYAAGLANIVELEDAQRHYTYDDANYANSLYAYSVAKAAVNEATGHSLSAVQKP